jgi:prevent-host-death family protein
MAIMAMRRKIPVRRASVAELKNQLSKYLSFVKCGHEVVIRDRNLPVARLVPFRLQVASDEELLLVAAGKMRLPRGRIDVRRLLRIPTARVSGSGAIQALVDERAPFQALAAGEHAPGP